MLIRKKASPENISELALGACEKPLPFSRELTHNPNGREKGKDEKDLKAFLLQYLFRETAGVPKLHMVLDQSKPDTIVGLVGKLLPREVHLDTQGFSPLVVNIDQRTHSPSNENGQQTPIVGFSEGSHIEGDI